MKSGFLRVFALVWLMTLSLSVQTAMAWDMQIGELTLCVYAEGWESQCHAYITIKNTSSETLNFNHYPLRPGDSMSLGAFGGDGTDNYPGGGIYINRDYCNADTTNSFRTSFIKTPLTLSQFNRIAQQSKTESHYIWTEASLVTWDALYHNCVTYATRMWNIAAPEDKQLADSMFGDAVPDIPRLLMGDVEKLEGHWSSIGATLPRKYTRYEEYHLNQTGTLIPYTVPAPFLWCEQRADGQVLMSWDANAEIDLMDGLKNITDYQLVYCLSQDGRIREPLLGSSLKGGATDGLVHSEYCSPDLGSGLYCFATSGHRFDRSTDNLSYEQSNVFGLAYNCPVTCDGVSIGFTSGDLFNRTAGGASGNLGYAYWCQDRINAVNGSSGTYARACVNGFLSPDTHFGSGTHIRTRSPERSWFITEVNGDQVYFTGLSDDNVVQSYGMSWANFCEYINRMGGTAYVELYGWTGAADPFGEVSARLYDGGVRLTGWAMDASDPAQPVTLRVEIGGGSAEATTNIRRDDLAYDGLHGFDLEVSTDARGLTRVRVIALNIGEGSDVVLYDEMVSFPSFPGINEDCVVTIDSPYGTYAWNSDIVIAGWIAANKSVASCIASGTGLTEPVDLTGTLYDASAELNAAGFGGYTVKRRFYKVVSRGHIGAGSDLRLDIDVVFDDGSKALARSTTFGMGALEIWSADMSCRLADGYGVERTTFQPGETAYLTVRVLNPETGGLLDRLNLSYQLNAAVYCPNGDVIRRSFTTNDNTLAIPISLAGEYKVEVIPSGGLRYLDSWSSAFSVPQLVRVRAKAWYSTEPMGGISRESWVGGTYYACYRLTDLLSEQLYNASAVSRDYTAVLEVEGPDGTVLTSRAFYNTDEGSIPFFAATAGDYTVRVRLQGSAGGEDLTDVHAGLQFTCRDAEIRLMSNRQYIQLISGASESVMVYKDGWTGTDYDYRCGEMTVLSGDVSASWSRWDEVINELNIHHWIDITATGDGRLKLMLELFDTRDDTVYASLPVYVEVSPGVRRIIYDANGGLNTPEEGVKQPRQAYRISSEDLSHGGPDDDRYRFLGWATTPVSDTVEYQPGARYTRDEDLCLYAVWEFGLTCAYEANGGRHAPENEWHCLSLGGRQVGGLPYRLSTTRPSRTGYDFLGWSEDPNALTAQWQPGDICTLNRNLSLYAVWRPQGVIVASGDCGKEATWVVFDDGCLLVAGSGRITEQSDPSWQEYEIKTLVVDEGITEIGDRAFRGLETLTGVTLPDTLTVIDSEAFSGCLSLPEIDVPDSVVYLGAAAFARCTSLESFVIGEGVKYIGIRLFDSCAALQEVGFNSGMSEIPYCMLRGCTSLERLTVPGRMHSVGNSAFENCTGLKEITFESGVKELGNSALSGATSLVSVHLPASLTKLGTGVFSGCAALTSIQLPTGLEAIPGTLLYGCCSLEEIQFPAGVTLVGRSALEGCKALTEVSIPEGVETLEESALARCDALTRVTLPSSLQMVGKYCFNSDKALRCVYVPSMDTQFDVGAYSGIDFYGFSGSALEQVCADRGWSFIPIATEESQWIIEDDVITGYRGVGGDVSISTELGVTAIGDGAFKDNTGITSICIPETVTRIGNEAFSGCAILRTVTFAGSGLNSIGRYAFYNCPLLTSIAVPEGVVELGAYVFAKCSKLAEVSLPSTLTTIGANAFYLSGVRSAVIPGSVSNVGFRCFAQCGELTSVIMREGVTEIGEDTFLLCEKLSSVDLPDTLTLIGDSAFTSCDGLEEIRIPGAVTVIDDSAFEGCKRLSRVVLQEGLKSLGKRAFYRCPKLQSIALPDTLTTLGQEVFSGSGLCTLTVPGSVVSLNTQVFNGADNLDTLRLEPGVKTLNTGALGSLPKLTTIAIPYTMTSLSKAMFDGCPQLTTLATGEDFYAEKWFKIYMPDVIIEHIWDPVVATGIELSASNYTLPWLTQRTLNATVTPEYARNKKVTWQSSDPERVSVDEKGRIMAHRSGCMVTITAVTEEGDLRANCLVTVPEGKLSVYLFPRNGSGETIQDTVIIKEGLYWKDYPASHKPGWTFEGWYLDNMDDARISSAVPIGWPEKPYATLYARYTPYEAADDIEAYLLDDGTCISAPLSEQVMEILAVEGAEVTSTDAGVATLQDGVLQIGRPGEAIIQVNLTDGGGTRFKVRVIAVNDVFRLPAALRVVEPEAFLGDTSIEGVYLPDGVQRIEARAFLGCTALKFVRIPDSVVWISGDAFDADYTGRMVCAKGSRAEQWCSEHGVRTIPG